MINLIDRFVKRRHNLIVVEQDVTTVLEAINSRRKWYINQNLAVGNCGWANEPTKWFVHFGATDNQWMFIIDGLNKKGYKLYLKDRPNDIYVSRRLES